MAQSSSSATTTATGGGGGGPISDAQKELKDFWDNVMAGVRTLTTVRNFEKKYVDSYN